MKDFFIAVYTHEVKSYCDIEFFQNIANFSSNNYELHVVDNTSHENYTEKLKSLISATSLELSSITHLITGPELKPGGFHVKVLDSVNYLRDLFLKSNCKYFLIIESDVLPPTDVLEKYEGIINEGDILGGIYYRGIHHDEWFSPNHKDLIDTVVFSGCTLYKRNLMEEISFKLNYNNLGMFPDTVMSEEARSKGYNLRLYTDIKCEHLYSHVGNRQFIRH